MKSKVTPEKELEHLRLEYEKLDAQHTAIRNRIYELEDLVGEPRLKKQFLGKYFRYDNSYGTGEKWPLYHYVVGVNGVELIVNSFQSEPYGQHEFKIGQSIPESSLGKRVDKKVWDSALRKFLTYVKKLK